MVETGIAGTTTEIGIAEIEAQTGIAGIEANNIIVNVVNINSDTARQWQPSANSQRRQAQHQRSNRANARNSKTI